MKIIKYTKKKNLASFYIKNNIITVTGVLGKLKYSLPSNYMNLKKNTIFIPKNQLFFFKNIIKSLFKSVNKGWSYQLDINGKGFKLFKYENYLSFDLGYSNLFLFKNKNDLINIYSTKYKIIINSINKVLLLNLISLLKKFYSVDKYHGKGIFFQKDKYIFYKKLM